MISAELRRTVRTLYAFACGYCGVTEIEVGALLTIDHFQPVDAGGTDDIANPVYTCHACNLFKSSTWNPLTPCILHPLDTDVDSHVRLLLDGTLQSLTPEGTRHIEALHLNRTPLVERRRLRLLIATVIEREAELQAKETRLDEEKQRRKRTIRKKARRKMNP